MKSPAFLRMLVALILAGTFSGLVTHSACGDQQAKEGDQGPQPRKVAELQRKTKVDFGKEVLPILTASCTACHNEFVDEGGLILETPEAILKGGRRGPSVVPGKPQESWLFKFAAHLAGPVMPPEDNDVEAKPLNPQQLGLIKLWIQQGATGKGPQGVPTVQWQALPPGINPIYAVALSPDGQYAACGRANQVFIYHVPTGYLVTRLTDPQLISGDLYSKRGVAHLDMIQSLAFSPDGSLLASGGFRCVKIWRRPQGTRKYEVDAGKTAQSVAASSDGKLLATGTQDGRVLLFDLETGKPKKVLSGHSAAVTDLAFAPDGSRLVSGSLDKTARLWDLSQSKESAQVETPAAVQAVTLVGNQGELLATGGSDNIIRLWKFVEGQAEEVRELKGHSKPLTALKTFANNKNLLASGSQDGTIRIWDAGNGRNTRSMNHGGPVNDIDLSPDGKRLVSVSTNNTAKIWDSANGRQLAEMQGDIRRQLEVAGATKALEKAKRELAESKKQLEAAQKDAPKKAEALKKANQAKGKNDETHRQKKAAYEKLAQEKKSLEEQLAKAATALQKAQQEQKQADETLKKASGDEAKKKATQAKKTADAQVAESQKEQKSLQAEIKKLDKPLSEAEKALQTAEVEKQKTDRAAAEAQRQDKLAKEAVPAAQLSVAAGEQLQQSREQTLKERREAEAAARQPMLSVSYSFDGQQIAVGSADGLIHTFDGTSGGGQEIFDRHQGKVLAVAFVPGNKLIAAAGDDAKTVVWDQTGDWRLERVIGNVSDPSTFVHRVLALDFSHNGQWLACGGGEPSRSGEIKVFRVADGSLVKELTEPHSDTVFDLAFSPKDQFVISGGADKFVKIHNLTDGQLAKSLEGHTHHVLGVSWRDDGDLAVSAGADEVIKVWNPETGEQKRTIKGFGKQVTAVQFVGDSDNILTACGDRLVRLYQASNGRSLRSFSGGTDYMNAVAVTADGNIVLAGGHDSILRVWSGENGRVLQTFEPPASTEASVASASAE